MLQLRWLLRKQILGIKAETADDDRPNGVLDDIAAELNGLIPGVERLAVALDSSSREYRIELTQRDGIPFNARVVSDGTLRVLALLTLLHDPRHRGLVCFEEPENGVHPGRVKELVRRLRDMVTDPTIPPQLGDPQPLSQLILNSHSPVVLSALVDPALHAVKGMVLFADTATISEPGSHERRRRTRLRTVRPDPQMPLYLAGDAPRDFVSDYEVRAMLDAAQTEG